MAACAVRITIGITWFLLMCAASLSLAGGDYLASYRKDYFYPYDWYKEINLPSPVNGGRFQIVGVAEGSGLAISYYLDGKLVTFSEDDWTVDWMHVYPPVLTKGEPMWVTFHTSDSKWDSVKAGQIRIVTDKQSVAMDGKFNVDLNFCNITYVTTDANYSSLLIHLHNGLSEKRTVSKVVLNNTDVTSRIKNTASLSPPPGTSTLLVIPLLKPVHPGDLYTVVLVYKDTNAVPSVAAGRIAKTFMPIEAWETTSDCPFPTINDQNYQWHRSHDIDTFYIGDGAVSECHTSVTLDQLISQLAIKFDFYTLPVSDINPQTISNTDHVLAMFCADEADDKIENVRKLMNLTRVMWMANPTLLTYIGGSRSRRNGIFAGVADIQGMDMYVAACAPHIQEFLDYPPLRGSYDYLRLTRNNHMPNPTWLYSQGLSHVWDAKVLGKVIYRDPDPAEFRIQAMSVISACAKGLMYFQSTVSTNDHYADTWKELGNINHDLRALKRFILEGDCTDMARSTDGDDWHSAESLVQAIRSREAILVPIINLKNNGGYSDLKCELGENVHWDTLPHGVTLVTVDVPVDFGSIVDHFEVQNGHIINTTSVVKLVKGPLQQILIKNVGFTDDLMTRMFVFANTLEVRKEVQQKL